MLSDVVTLAALVQQAPALVLAALALLFAGWTFRQARRADTSLEARLSVSAVRQGKRIGRAEQTLGLLDMRRRITEQELDDCGIRLSYWPPDGPRLTAPHDEDRDDEPTDYTTEAVQRVPVPPVPGMPDRLARHRG